MSDQAKGDQTKPKSPQTDPRDRTSATATGSQSEQLKAKAKAGEKMARDTAAGVGQEAEGIASDIASKAKKGVSDTATRLRSAVEEQKTAGAERAKGIAGAINRAADELDEEIPQAAHYVRRAAEELEHLSDEVRERDVGDLLGIVQSFARRQPTVFLGATALAGFAAVRFFMTSAQPRRGSPASSDMEWDQAGPGPSTSAGRSTSSHSAGSEAQNANAQKSTPPIRASGTSSAFASSGDPGSVSPEAPGFKPKPYGSNSNEA